MLLAAVQSPSSPPLACDFSALFDIIERVESLPGDACGAFVLTGAESEKGTVYVECGRVCWAAVRGMGRRLTDLVLREADTKISIEDIEGLYQSCRVEGSPWGQTLVERGIVSPDGLRNALGRHTAEAIAAVTNFAQLRCHWLDRGNASYDAMFTFDMVEVGAWVGSLRHRDHRKPALGQLEELVPVGTFAAAYVWPDTRIDELPIAVVSSSERSVATAIELGRWAHNQLQLAEAVAERCSPVTAIAADGQAIVTWKIEHGYCAAICESFATMARVLSGLARAVPRRAA